MKHKSQQGVALVVTLIMLSLVTFLAIAFLGVSQRERISNTLTSSQTAARFAADAGFVRAQTEWMAALLRITNRYAYDIMVSTNFFEPGGFIPQGANTTPTPLNVNYDYVAGLGRPLFPDEFVQNVANLLYDPRPPVFVPISNLNSALPQREFRFYVDINRNGTNERTGLLPEIATNGQWYTTSGTLIAANTQSGIQSNFFTGDPEYVGILEHPGFPHSASNRFVARYAYLVLPAGKSLDLNFIHNQAKQLNAVANDGFMRDQGYGTWEINLAGFLAQLNTNLWDNPGVPYIYNTNAAASFGVAFEDAAQLLRYRYNGDYRNLDSFGGTFGNRGFAALLNQKIDAFSDGYQSAKLLPSGTNIWMQGPYFTDTFTNNWPGAANTNVNAVAYYDIQEVFATNGPVKYPGSRPYTNFTLTLKNLMSSSPGSYDRYTFMRLLAQMGVDSAPPLAGAKLNLNFDNIPPNRATDFVPWTARKFFMNATDRMIQTYLPAMTNVNGTFLSITNIQVYPVSSYTAELHRLLQVAANIYDAMSPNQVLTNVTIQGLPSPYPVPNPPSVFRPIFAKAITNGVTNISIVDYVEVTNVPAGGVGVLGSFFSTNNWMDVEEAATNSAVPAGLLVNFPYTDPQTRVTKTGDASLKGIPIVIGAKKGLPNFNEFGSQTIATLTRKIELAKINASNQFASFTNEMLVLNISNRFGLELYNSYSTAYPHALEMRATNEFSMGITNNVGTNAPPQPPLYVLSSTVAFNQAFGPGALQGGAIFWRSNVTLVLPNVILYTNSTAPPGTPSFGFTNLTTNTSINAFQNVGQGLPVPKLGISITNKLKYILVDTDTGHIVDCVTLTNLISGMDLLSLLRPQRNQPVPGLDIGDLFDPTPTANGMNRGVTNQIWVGMNDPNQIQYRGVWRYYLVPGQAPLAEINRFRKFLGTNAIGPNTNVIGNTTRTMQSPYVPSVRLVQGVSWSANDPLVHYMVSDLLDPIFAQNITNTPPQPLTVPISWTAPPMSLGATNTRYAPWNRIGTSDKTNAANLAVKDPGVWSSDNWDFYPMDSTAGVYFPSNRFANIGWLGRVHRGTPWQTIYMKSRVQNPVHWFNYSGSRGTHPTNDWRLFDLFTTAVNDNAARGQLSVNQTNIAAWAAILSGVPVVSNSDNTIGPLSKGGRFSELIIQPGSTQMVAMVDGLSRMRTNFYGGVYSNVGGILATPELTELSPYLDRSGYQMQNAITDAAYEKIPQQIMSLLTLEENPRVAIYSFGQALKPAQGRPFVLTPGPFFGLCTNYQIVGETVTRTVLHVENLPRYGGASPTNWPRVVVESFNIVPALDF